MDKQFEKYFIQIQTGQSLQAPKATIETPIPVQNVPAPPGLDNLLVWATQGGIYGFMGFLVYFLGKPAFDFLSLRFSEESRRKKELETRSQESLVMLNDTLKSDQTYLRSLIDQGLKQNASELTQVFTALTGQLSKIEEANRSYQQRLEAVLNGREAIKIRLDDTDQVLRVRLIDEVETRTEIINRD